MRLYLLRGIVIYTTVTEITKIEKDVCRGMGVKFNRDYNEISADLASAVADIADCYEFFEMSKQDWTDLAEEDQQELVRTLSDDLFYGLGDSSSIRVGSGKIEYDPGKHVIKVTTNAQVVHIVHLI